MVDNDLYKNKEIKKLTIKDINNPNFKNLNGFLVIYAPWCSHCKKQESTWYTINREFKYIYPVFVLNGNLKQNEPLLKKLDITHFPTIFTIKKGEIKPYLFSTDENDLKIFLWSNQ